MVEQRINPQYLHIDPVTILSDLSNLNLLNVRTKWKKPYNGTVVRIYLSHKPTGLGLLRIATSRYSPGVGFLLIPE